MTGWLDPPFLAAVAVFTAGAYVLYVVNRPCDRPDERHA